MNGMCQLSSALHRRFMRPRAQVGEQLLFARAFREWLLSNTVAD